MELRYLSKRFKCDNCNKRFKKLVHYEEEKTKCENCGSEEARYIEENEFNREDADRTYRLTFDGSNGTIMREYHPRTDIFDRDPNNLYGDARRNSPRQRAQETGSQGQRTQQFSQTQQGQNVRSNASNISSQGQRQTQRNVFTNANTQSNVLNQNGQSQQVRRQIPIYRQIFIPYRISPFSGSVRRQPMDNLFGILGVFDSFFITPNSDFFMDNFASNFTSNFEDPLTRIIFLQSMQNQPQDNPPASKEAVKSLKKFQMSQEFCKKDEKGNLEYPSCSVCLTEIAEKEDTILIPCGHMFHEPCITKWLDMHNSCPVCRYELPTDDPDYERTRQQRTSNGTVHTNTTTSTRGA